MNPEPARKGNRQIIRGTMYGVTSGRRQRDCPAAYGRQTTVYNRFSRWSRRGFWKAMFPALAKAG
ncbi:transposase [Methylobacterium sp. E-005]|uniref:transposase n=1 Tax=Methylobacterium sp. E-005 TaxID=2836549 RepID=UPI003918FBAD